MRFFRTAPGILLIVFVLVFANPYLPYLLTPIFFLDLLIFGNVTFDMLMQYQKEFYYYSRDFFNTIELMAFFTTILCVILYRIYEAKQERKGCLTYIFRDSILVFGLVLIGFVCYYSYSDFFKLIRDLPYARNYVLTIRHIDHSTFFIKKENRFFNDIPYTYIKINEDESIKLYPQSYTNREDVEPYINQRIDIFYLPYTKRVLFMKKCDLEDH